MDRKGTKQETLEEFISKTDTPDGLDQFSYDKGLEDGAKWQQEQDKNKFSEEDMKQAFFDGIRVTGEGYNGEYVSGNNPDIEVEFYESYTEWFEQFKKNKDNEL